MFGDGSLTFREFAMREPLPLAVIHDAVLESYAAVMTPCCSAPKRSTPTSRNAHDRRR